MESKIEQLESELDLIHSENKLLRNTIKKLRDCEAVWKNEHEKYSRTMETMRARVRESNVRLENFSQLFKRLQKDMEYLNKTTDLVHFAEESAEVLKDTMLTLDYQSTIHQSYHNRSSGIDDEIIDEDDDEIINYR